MGHFKRVLIGQFEDIIYPWASPLAPYVAPYLKSKPLIFRQCNKLDSIQHMIDLRVGPIKKERNMTQVQYRGTVS